MKFNESYFEQLGKSQGVTNLCKQVAERIAADARADAPVKTGAYQSKIRVRVKQASKRNVALVVADDYKSLWIESRRGVLARALRRAKRAGF